MSLRTLEELLSHDSIVPGLVLSGSAKPVAIDYLSGPAFMANTYQGSPGNDSINGSASDDLIFGYGGLDILYGAGGTDQLFGGADTDILDGGAGKDYLYGEAGNDRLYGGLNNDELTGGVGADHLDGGDGDDFAFYTDSEQGIFINLGAGTASGGTATGDVLQSIENVYGGKTDDVIYGSSGFNYLLGYWGSDMLVGEGGVDLLDGGLGDDMLIANKGGSATMWGGSGDDHFVVFPECQALVVDFSAGPGTDDEIWIYKNVFATAQEALAAVTQVGSSVFITKGSFSVELFNVHWWQLHADDFVLLDI